MDNSIELPSAYDPVERSAAAQEFFPVAERQFVNDARMENLRYVELGPSSFQIRPGVVNVWLQSRLGRAGRVGQDFAERVIQLAEDAVTEPTANFSLEGVIVSRAAVQNQVGGINSRIGAREKERARR